MPRAAILINNYNNGPWLRACVDSALAQTRPADEVVVYDDGSTDDSLSLLRSYGDHIRLIEGDHDFSRPGRASQRAAMRAAFEASSAEHLYFLDGDDAYLPTHLADYEAAWATAPDTVMLQCPMTRVNAEGRELGLYHEPLKHRPDLLAHCYRVHENDFYYLTSALAFRRDFLTRVFPLLEHADPAFANDCLLATHALFSGSVLTLPAPTVLYRVRSGSLGELNGTRSPLRALDTRSRARCFNQIAAHYGRPPIRIWLNLTYLQQVARLWLPAWASAPFARLKAALHRRSA